MKAVLILDEMPTACIKCPFHQCFAYGLTAETYCILTAKRNEDGINTKAEWCPLRPLPCKKYMRQMPSDVLEKGKRKRDFIIHKVDVDNSYVEGWNECIDAIVGETE